MSTEQISTAPRTRRAVLAASLTGVAALAAQALGRPSPAQAHDPDDIQKGVNNVVTALTEVSNTANNNGVFWAQSISAGTALYGTSSSGYGVLAESFSGTAARGSSTSGYGLHGVSTSSVGVYGKSTDDDAIVGESGAAGHSAVWGTNTAGGYGVSGSTSGSSTAGVWGSNSGAGAGVRGTSVSGRAVHGKSTSGWAGFFEGRVFATKFFELKEITLPAKPNANRARLFARDDGSGKTQLCVRFSNGVVRVLATM